MIAATKDYLAEVWEAWNDFWFEPTSPTTLSAIRLPPGPSLSHPHPIWSSALSDFIGQNRWLPESLMHTLHRAADDPDGPGPAVGTGWNLIWSHLHYIHSPTMMWTIHIIALVV